MVKVQKSISITYEQDQYIKKHDINLSKLVRERIEELREESEDK